MTETRNKKNYSNISTCDDQNDLKLLNQLFNNMKTILEHLYQNGEKKINKKKHSIQILSTCMIGDNVTKEFKKKQIGNILEWCGKTVYRKLKKNETVQNVILSDKKMYFL